MTLHRDDHVYYIARAERERLRAAVAVHSNARVAHLELARLYEQRCGVTLSAPSPAVVG